MRRPLKNGSAEFTPLPCAEPTDAAEALDAAEAAEAAEALDAAEAAEALDAAEAAEALDAAEKIFAPRIYFRFFFFFTGSSGCFDFRIGLRFSTISSRGTSAGLPTTRRSSIRFCKSTRATSTMTRSPSR